MAIRTNAIKTCKQIFAKIENEGPLVQINAQAHQLSLDLSKGDKFEERKPLQKPKKSNTRIWQKIKRHAKRGAKLGAASGNYIAMPLHFIFGRGGVNIGKGYSRTKVERLMDRGLVGYGLYYTAMGLSEGFHLLGLSSGLGIGAISIPMKPNLKHGKKAWIIDTGEKIGDLSGTATAYLVSVPLGLSSNILRLPGTCLIVLGKALGLIGGSIYGTGLGIKKAISHAINQQKHKNDDAY